MHIQKIGRRSLLLLATTVGFAAQAASASAATLTVTTTGDPAATMSSTCSTTCSLRDAIIAADAAGGASTITVPAGTYTLSQVSTGSNDPTTGDLDINNSSSVTIVGAGAGKTIIDAGHIDRAFAVQQGSSLSISGVTITHGESSDATPDSNSTAAGYGGAIYNDGSLSVSNSVITDSTAYYYGGGIYSDAQATGTTVTDSTVSHDSEYDDYGAGIAVTAGSLTLNGDTISENAEEDSGGAVYATGSNVNVSVTNSDFTANATYQGGAIYLSNAGNLTISGSSFDKNGSYDGGAIMVSGSGTSTITNSSFTDNSANNYNAGGAIYASSSGLLTVTGSSFTGNSSGYYGGAIYMSSTDLSVSSSTFSDNPSSYYGGAIYVDGAAASGPGNTPNETIKNSTFDGNSSVEGGAVYDAGGYLAITDSTLSENTSSNEGGALYYDSGDGLTLTNDTIDDNAADYGAGLYLATDSSASDPITLLNDTIAGNTAYDGGGIVNPYYANSISDTIVADNVGQTRESSPAAGDCDYGADYSTYTADAGHNLDSDGSCFGGDTATGDKTGVDPMLAGLADNGGGVFTDALLPGSPAIGAGSGCASTDERGVSRGSNCDIGAFQTAATDLSVTGSGTKTVGSGGLLNYTFKVGNTGPGDDGNVSFADKLPAGTSFVYVATSQGSCTGTGSITCALGALDSGSSATVTIVARATKSGTVKDTGSVTGAFSDPSTANNSATIATKVTAAASLKPSVITGAASKIGLRQASVAVVVSPGTSRTTYWVVYGTSRRFGKRTGKKVLSGHVALHVFTLKGLKPGKKYFFAVKAQNANGTSTGHTRVFRTR